MRPTLTALACPHCRFTMREGRDGCGCGGVIGNEESPPGYWSDGEPSSRWWRFHYGPPRVARCTGCQGFFRLDRAEPEEVPREEYFGLPQIHTHLTPELLAAAAAGGAARGPAEEAELRTWAWRSESAVRRAVLANGRSGAGDQSPEQEREAASRDWALATRPLAMWAARDWLRLESDLGTGTRPVFWHDPLGWERERRRPAEAPDPYDSSRWRIRGEDFTVTEFARLLYERDQARERSLRRLRPVVEPAPLEGDWRQGNLKALAASLTALDPAAEVSFLARLLPTGWSGLPVLRAEVLRQLGRFEEALRLVGDSDGYVGFGASRHWARAVADLARRGEEGLWFVAGDEDLTPAELAAHVQAERPKVEAERREFRESAAEQARQQERRRAAEERRREHMVRAEWYQAEVDRRGGTAGLSIAEQVEQRIVCPRCHFRYAWDGESCGHCAKP